MSGTPAALLEAPAGGRIPISKKGCAMKPRSMRIEHEIISHVNQALCLAVRAPITKEQAESWLERVCFLADSFGRHLSRLFSIEEDGGYMDFVLESPQPTLANRVDQLWSEHRELLQELHQTIREARSARPDNLANLHELRQRLSGFISRFDEHRRKECELCFEAFLVDIGGEGG